MRNYDDCVFDMICPACGVDLNQHSNTQISMVKEITYQVEYPVLGRGSNEEIEIEARNPLISDEDTSNLYFQCDNCGTELPYDFVKALVTRWDEIDTESKQEIEEESKANLG